MKHIYVLSSGEYSDYNIEGVVISDTPIDWKAAKDKMVVWLNENHTYMSWYLSEETKTAMLAAAGLTRADYEEITIEPRWKGDSEWGFID